MIHAFILYMIQGTKTFSNNICQSESNSHRKFTIYKKSTQNGKYIIILCIICNLYCHYRMTRQNKREFPLFSHYILHISTCYSKTQTQNTWLDLFTFPITMWFTCCRNDKFQWVILYLFFATSSLHPSKWNCQFSIVTS